VTQLDGFQIVRPLGRGGMGEVFEAVRVGPGGFRRAVALKRLIGDYAVRGAAVERFLVEARILARLHHRNVVEVYDVLATDSGYVLVMELLTGATVRELARAAGDAGLPIADVCAIADQVLVGLDYVHGARGEDGRPLGLIHRDVTPNNVFVTTAGDVKLLDFGIAKLRGALDAPVTRDGEVRGTLELIAPEQARGESVDPRTDLYQLAASLYWLATGRYPHGSGSAAELLARAGSVRPPLVAELRPDLPPAVAATIDRAMALEPVDRFAAAAEMRAALAPAVPADGAARLAARVAGGATPRDAAPSTAPPTVAETPHARRDARRPPSRARAWIAVAIAAAAATATVALWLARREADSAAPPSAVGVTVGGADGVLSATPLAHGRVAFATDRAIVIAALHGGDQRTIPLPADVAPVDVAALANDRIAITAQRSDGEYAIVVADGTGAHMLPHVYLDRALAAVHPDGAIVAHTDYSGVWLSADPPAKAARVEDGESVVALAWSPDGSRLAAFRVRAHGDPTIDVVDPKANATTSIRRAPLAGDVAAFGWLDVDRLAYAIDEPDGAVLYRMAIATRSEVELARLPGERVVAGHVATGAIAFVHGAVRHVLLVGSSNGMTAVETAARAVAGLDRDGRAVIANGEPIGARASDGAVTRWPGTLAGDTPQTLAGGSALAIRGDAVWRVGESSRRLVQAAAPRGATVVRCAGDAAAPCVVADASAGTWTRYSLLDPETGDLGATIAEHHGGVDHALDRDGKTLAIVDRGHDVAIVDVASGKKTWRPLGRGVELDGVAWLGHELVVSARRWQHRPWVLLAIGDSGTLRVLAEARDRTAAQVRANGDALAVVATDVAPTLSVLPVP
jgi:serine/threonine-protein kinase